MGDYIYYTLHVTLLSSGVTSVLDTALIDSQNAGAITNKRNQQTFI